jgi:REP element-mobilizing transposase RayT
MGQDKGLLQKDNTTWAGRSMEMMTGLVQNVAVSVNKNQWYRYSKDLVSKKRIELNAFVPIAIGMNNHVHFIWQALQSFTPSQNQASFMKFTARQLLLCFFKDDKGLHSSLKVNKYDRD